MRAEKAKSYQISKKSTGFILLRMSVQTIFCFCKKFVTFSLKTTEHELQTGRFNEAKNQGSDIRHDMNIIRTNG